ncbi:TBC1 domain family member 7, partial [Asbolus verrucosus]
MAIDERNFRSAYYEKVGFKSVEEKRSLEILLKEKQLDLSKLKQFCLRFGVPAAHRNLVWKLLLGVLPLQEKCHEFVVEQRKDEYSNLIHALNVLRITNDLPKSQVFVAMWLLQNGKLRFETNYESEKGLMAVVKSMLFHFDCDIDVYWLAKMFYDTVQKFQCEVPKLIEATQNLLEKEDPKLFRHLLKIDALETLPLDSWFDCCFAGILNDMALGRIWDKIVGGSYKILVYTSVVILTSLKHKLMRCNTLECVIESINSISEELAEVIVNKSVELWQQQGSPLTAYDKPKPIVSILTVFINKTLLSDIELNAPMFIALYQTFITAVICFIKKSLALMFPHHVSFPETNVWDLNTIKTILPVSVMFTTMIATNNLCLKYVSVAFYYIGRSLTTIFNVFLTYLILGEKTSAKCLLFCGVIMSGFYLGVDQENLAGSLSISGTVFGVLGSLSLSLFSILTKKVLPKVNNEIWALSYYNNIYATILFLPLMLFNNEFLALYNYIELLQTHFWFIMTIGGICGFAIGFFTSLQIKYTSALTHNISGTAKACAQTILATYWYQETKTLLWWCSNIIILFGSAGYARIKQLDMEKKHKQNVMYQK